MSVGHIIISGIELTDLKYIEKGANRVWSISGNLNYTHYRVLE